MSSFNPLKILIALAFLVVSLAIYNNAEAQGKNKVARAEYKKAGPPDWAPAHGHHKKTDSEGSDCCNHKKSKKHKHDKNEAKCKKHKGHEQEVRTERETNDRRTGRTEQRKPRTLEEIIRERKDREVTGNRRPTSQRNETKNPTSVFDKIKQRRAETVDKPENARTSPDTGWDNASW